MPSDPARSNPSDAYLLASTRLLDPDTDHELWRESARLGVRLIDDLLSSNDVWRGPDDEADALDRDIALQAAGKVPWAQFANALGATMSPDMESHLRGTFVAILVDHAALPVDVRNRLMELKASLTAVTPDDKHRRSYRSASNLLLIAGSAGLGATVGLAAPAIAIGGAVVLSLATRCFEMVLGGRDLELSSPRPEPRQLVEDKRQTLDAAVSSQNAERIGAALTEVVLATYHARTVTRHWPTSQRRAFWRSCDELDQRAIDIGTEMERSLQQDLKRGPISMMRGSLGDSGLIATREPSPRPIYKDLHVVKGLPSRSLEPVMSKDLPDLAGLKSLIRNTAELDEFVKDGSDLGERAPAEAARKHDRTGMDFVEHGTHEVELYEFDQGESRLPSFNEYERDRDEPER